MKKLVKQFNVDFKFAFERKPTLTEVSAFIQGVRLGINQVHNDLHTSIDKIVKLKK